jgi:hypothetical protein
MACLNEEIDHYLLEKSKEDGPPFCKDDSLICSKSQNIV